MSLVSPRVLVFLLFTMALWVKCVIALPQKIVTLAHSFRPPLGPTAVGYLSTQSAGRASDKFWHGRGNFARASRRGPPREASL